MGRAVIAERYKLQKTGRLTGRLSSPSCRIMTIEMDTRKETERVPPCLTGLITNSHAAHEPILSWGPGR